MIYRSFCWSYRLCTMYIVHEGGPKYNYFREKNSMTEGKRKLEWRRVRIYIRFFKILFISRSSNCKNLFADFQKFYYTTFLMNLNHFQYFDHTKKISKKINLAAFLIDCAPLKKFAQSAHAHNVIFSFGFWALLERRVDEIKNEKKINKIILLLHRPSFARYHRIFILLI